ncbi:hypothetical protein ACSRUE_00765 [Sorangium sp. KYC3313]|uniref:hypothetical protein n=1 Tax=Sorangium sp. KYC3313 TaxID=3449740 RepID=UPI003F8CAAC8
MAATKTYTPRIGSDPAYIQAVGQAFYNFTYLEWSVIWLVAKLKSGYFGEIESANPPKTAGTIRRDLAHEATASKKIDAPTRAKLVAISRRFDQATRRRNLLLHAHPFTDQDGNQLLGGLSHGTRQTWTIDDVLGVAEEFEVLAREANAVLHQDLKGL